MTISATSLLKETNTANTNPYTTTGSPTLHANKLGLLAIMTQKAGGAVSPTSISGPGTTTWVEITHVDFDTIATPLRRLTLYRACNSADQTGTITANFAAGQSNCFFSLDELSGTKATSANNGSDGINTNIVTNRNDSATASPFTVTLAALSNVNNAAFGAFGAYAQTQNYSAGTGLTLLGNSLGSGTASDSGDIASEWGINVTTVRVTYTTAQGNCGIAVEVLATTGTTFTQSVSGSLSFTGALTKRDNKKVTGTLSFTGPLTKRDNKSLSGALSFTGVIHKKTLIPLSGGLSFTGILSKTKVALKNLSGSLSFTGVLTTVHKFTKALSGALSFIGITTPVKTGPAPGGSNDATTHVTKPTRLVDIQRVKDVH